MLRFLAFRLLRSVLTLLVAMFLFQVALTVLPGDPIRALFGPSRPDPVVLAAMHAEFGFDDPLLVQYGNRVGGLLTGDLGHTFPGAARNRVEVGPPVTAVVSAAAPHSARLVAGALLIQGVVGIGLGVMATLRRGAPSASVIYLSSLGMVSVPVIVLAYALQAVFGWQLGWLPVSGLMEGDWGYVLPTLSIALPGTAYLVLLTRSELGETLRRHYIKAAAARAIPQHRVIGRHALRASAVPLVTFMAANLGTLLSALLVVEGIYNIPGVGGLTYHAIQTLDRALLIALLTLATIAVVVANLIADVAYAVIDPRIRVP